MAKGIALTETDRNILKSYYSILEGLDQFLGEGYELVLHSLEDLDSSAVKVINGHYTGRKEGAPITDLALRMLSEIKRSGDNHKNLVYFNRSKSGTPIRSATLPITGENEQIIGLLCINFFMDIPMNKFFNGLFLDENGKTDPVENYASSSQDLLKSTTINAQRTVLNDPSILSSNRNKAIISILNDKDIFQFKDSVAIVAEQLGISKNTVYLHLRNLNNGNNGEELS